MGKKFLYEDQDFADNSTLFTVYCTVYSTVGDTKNILTTVNDEVSLIWMSQAPCSLRYQEVLYDTEECKQFGPLVP